MKGKEGGVGGLESKQSIKTHCCENIGKIRKIVFWAVEEEQSIFTGQINKKREVTRSLLHEMWKQNGIIKLIYFLNFNCISKLLQ